MAKKTEENAISTAPVPLQLSVKRNDLVPEYMQSETDRGTSEMGKYVRPPRAKVIQDKRDQKYSQFQPGSVILTPQNEVLVSNNEPFWFVPLLFYPEWACCNPYELKGTLNMIRARSLDPRSDIAMKARDDKRRDAERCPEAPKDKDWRLRYVEFLNFVVVIVNHPTVSGTPVTMSFARGEHKNGEKLSSLIMGRHAPIWGCVFEGRVSPEQRRNNMGSWYGIDVMNPTSDGCPHPFVQDPQHGSQLKEKHVELRSVLEAGVLRADLGEDDDAPASPAETDKY